MTVYKLMFLFSLAALTCLSGENSKSIFGPRPDQMIDCQKTAPRSIQAGDVNNDGRNDLIIGCHPTKSVKEAPDGVRVYYRREKGNFSAEPDLKIAVKSPWGILVKDLDGDKKNDIVASQSRKFIYLCYAAKDFKPVKYVDANMYSTGILEADLNPSLKEKLTASFLTCAVWWRVTANGQVKSSYIHRPPKNQSGLPAAGDLNNDGNLDLVYPQDDRFLIYYGPFPATSIKPAMLSEVSMIDTPPVHGKCRQVAIGDFNQDERMDIAVLCQNGILFYYQNSPSGFPERPSKILTGKYLIMETADLNHDKLADLVVLKTGCNEVDIYLQGKNGIPETPDQVINSRYTYRIALKDLNRKGSADLILANTRGFVNIYYNHYSNK